MSLLVHELVIGAGGGRGTGTSLQATPSAPVPLASVPVAYTSSGLQVTQLPQTRVVTITSTHPRNNPAEKGSRLAEALIGNPPYCYSNSYSFLRTQQTHQHQPVSQVVSGPTITHVTQVQSAKNFSSRHNYILPFVLQDHNYGAPPPSTPPHSPPPPPPLPPPPVVSAVPYKVHQIVSPSKANIPNQRSSSTLTSYNTSPNKTLNQLRKVTAEQSIITVNNVGTVHIASTTAGSAGSMVASQIMESMPLYRQQFMPHPKTALFSAPPIHPPSRTETLPSQTISSTGGADTDEESRLSDQSSSAGPSGEETETAPEGEGEEVQADDSITRCICNFTHDDGYMIQCDRCFVWQHVDCMDIDRANIPDEYLCEACLPRQTNRNRARSLQVKRRQEIRAHLARVSSSDSDDNVASVKNKNSSAIGKSHERKVFKKKKPKHTSKENKSNRRHSVSSHRSVSNTALLNSTSVKVPPVMDRDLKLINKSKRRQSVSSSTVVEEDLEISFSDQLRSWIEDYEIAVTNHYSQELRARVLSARINGISQEFRESTQAAMLGHRCRVAPSYDVNAEAFEHKVLVATTHLAVGTAIIEYQGKYTLKSLWNSVQVPPGLPYLPFVLQYNMQKEGLHICVDARTYGNDARFARRSDQYNTEIRHVVERGSVHLYIVAYKEIEEEDEIILPLETAICSPVTVNRSSQQKSSSKPASVEISRKDGNENVKSESVKAVTVTSPIRRNGTIQSNSKKCVRKPLLTLSLPQPLNRTSKRSTSEVATEDLTIQKEKETAPPQVKQRRASEGRSPVKAQIKSPNRSPLKTPSDSSINGDSPHTADIPSGDPHKMTREERKIAAYMKAFERMEKAAQRRQEIQKRRVEGKDRKQSEEQEEEDDDESSKSADENPIRAEKGKRRGKKTNRGTPLKQKTVSYEDFGSDNNSSYSEGERNKSSDGSVIGYGSPPSSSGSLSGFRFPKTKKALMNEWLNETVDPVLHSAMGEVSSGVPTCYMRSPSTPSRKGSAVIGLPNVVSSNVRTNAIEMAGRSAKKRWLRQAIIDEIEPQSATFSFCSSPNSRPDSPTGADYITPLKKRRLARESMSSEQSNTPPSTPVHSSLEEKFSEEVDIDHLLLEASGREKVEVDLKTEIKEEDDDDDDVKPKIYQDINDESDCCHFDRLTINISHLSKTVKSEADAELEISGKCYKLDTKVKEEGTEDNKSLVRSVKKKSRNSKSKTCKTRSEEVSSREKKGKRLGFKFKSGRNKAGTELKRKSSKKSLTSAKTKKYGKCKKKTKKKQLSQILKDEDAYKMSNSAAASLSEPDVQSSLNLKDERPEQVEKDNSVCSDIKQADDLVADVSESCEQVTNEKLVPSSADLKTDSLDAVGDDAASKNSGRDADSLSHQTDSTALVEDRSEVKRVESADIPAEEKKEIKAKEHSSVFISEDGVNDNLCPAELPDVNSVVSSSNETAPPVHPVVLVKKKLSILEYRKRKSISCERDSKECTKLSSSSGRPGIKSVSLDKEAEGKIAAKRLLPPCPVLDDGNRDQGFNAVRNEILKELLVPHNEDLDPVLPLDDLDSPPSPLSPKSVQENMIAHLNGRGSGGNQSSKWNAAPTLLEQQRENLTARLRKNFGLCIPAHKNEEKILDTEEKSIAEKLAEIEKRLSLSEQMKTKTTAISMSIAPPTFSKVNLSSQFIHSTKTPSPIPDIPDLAVEYQNFTRYSVSSSVSRPSVISSTLANHEAMNSRKLPVSSAVVSTEQAKEMSHPVYTPPLLPYKTAPAQTSNATEALGGNIELCSNVNSHQAES